MAIEPPADYRRYRRYFVELKDLYQKKKVRVYTGIVLSLFVVAFFLFFAIRPTLKTIAALTKEIKDKKVVAQKLQDKINALNSAQIEYQRIEDELYLIDQALPENANLSLLIQQLEALARQHGVTIASIQFNQTTLKGIDEAKEKASKTGEQSAGFSLAIAGNYQNLKSLVDSLAKLRRSISIEALVFQTGDEQVLLLNLGGEAHYLSPVVAGASEQ